MNPPNTPLPPPAIFRPSLLLLAALFCTAGASQALAGDQEIRTHVIQVETDGSDVIEADVSDLELGESLNFVTDSGRVIDILKATEGIEIYIDGELLDAHGDHHDLEQLHRDIAIHEEQLEIHCDEEDADACRAELHALMEGEFENAEVIIARREVSEVCDDQGNCSSSVWIEKDSDLTTDILDKDSDARVIIIERRIDGELY